MTPHACSKKGQYTCSGDDCGDTSAGQRQEGVCDKDGCDFAPYRLGATDFYGEGAAAKVPARGVGVTLEALFDVPAGAVLPELASSVRDPRS